MTLSTQRDDGLRPIVEKLMRLECEGKHPIGVSNCAFHLYIRICSHISPRTLSSTDGTKHRPALHRKYYVTYSRRDVANLLLPITVQCVVLVSPETNMTDPKDGSILDIVLARPWWVSLTIAAVAYVAWRFVPPLIAGYPHLAELANGLLRVAPPLSIMFAAVVPVALLSRLHRRRLLKDEDAESAHR